jgi:hypothetical protein
MYCSRCGQPIGSQPACPSCGAPNGLINTMPQAGSAVGCCSSSKVFRHVRTLGILWVVYAVYSALQWMLVLPFLHSFFGGRQMWMPGPPVWNYGPFHPGSGLLEIISVMVLGRALLGLGVGIALLTRQSWGRIFAIVLGILILFKPLLGTLLGVYTLWVLLSRNADQDYAQLVAEKDLGFPPTAGVPGAPLN